MIKISLKLLSKGFVNLTQFYDDRQALSNNQQAIGVLAEEIACEYLVRQGLRCLTRNYLSRMGEIDLIMQDQNQVVFVEVRFRKASYYGSPLETITRSKQKKLVKTALSFLQQRKWLHKISSRFDVIAIQQIKGKMQIEWIKNAFYGDY
jgi:putative endonuclease